jgi:hypothetical protein
VTQEGTHTAVCDTPDTIIATFTTVYDLSKKLGLAHDSKALHKKHLMWCIETYKSRDNWTPNPRTDSHGFWKEWAATYRETSSDKIIAEIRRIVTEKRWAYFPLTKTMIMSITGSTEHPAWRRIQRIIKKHDLWIIHKGGKRVGDASIYAFPEVDS